MSSMPQNLLDCELELDRVIDMPVYQDELTWDVVSWVF
jgi:hypothetical protein